MLCDPRFPVKVATAFEAQLILLEHKNIICAGYNAVLHVHTCVEEITLGVSFIFFEWFTPHNCRHCCIWLTRKQAESRSDHHPLSRRVKLLLPGLNVLVLFVWKRMRIILNLVVSRSAMKVKQSLWVKSQSWLILYKNNHAIKYVGIDITIKEMSRPESFGKYEVEGISVHFWISLSISTFGWIGDEKCGFILSFDTHGWSHLLAILVESNTNRGQTVTTTFTGTNTNDAGMNGTRNAILRLNVELGQSVF